MKRKLSQNDSNSNKRLHHSNPVAFVKSKWDSLPRDLQTKICAKAADSCQAHAKWAQACITFGDAARNPHSWPSNISNLQMKKGSLGNLLFSVYEKDLWMPGNKNDASILDAFKNVPVTCIHLFQDTRLKQEAQTFLQNMLSGFRLDKLQSFETNVPLSLNKPCPRLKKLQYTPWPWFSLRDEEIIPFQQLLVPSLTTLDFLCRIPESGCLLFPVELPRLKKLYAGFVSFPSSLFSLISCQKLQDVEFTQCEFGDGKILDSLVCLNKVNMNYTGLSENVVTFVTRCRAKQWTLEIRFCDSINESAFWQALVDNPWLRRLELKGMDLPSDGRVFGRAKWTSLEMKSMDKVKEVQKWQFPPTLKKYAFFCDTIATVITLPPSMTSALACCTRLAKLSFEHVRLPCHGILFSSLLKLKTLELEGVWFYQKEGLSPNLDNLVVDKCSSLHILDDLPRLTRLRLNRIPLTEALSHMKHDCALSTLILYWMHDSNPQDFSQIQKLVSLRHLSLFYDSRDLAQLLLLLPCITQSLKILEFHARDHVVDFDKMIQALLSRDDWNRSVQKLVFSFAKKIPSHLNLLRSCYEKVECSRMQ